jgi:aminomethyltransferase
LKRTAFFDEHVAAGGKLIDFVGWAMPMEYTGIIDEHRRVRSTVGMFDVSHMGEFHLSGEGALADLERITTNRVAALVDGRVQYSAMCYENGGFIDDLLVYRLGDSYMLVVNAANKQKDLDWIRSHIGTSTEFRDASDETALIAVQGPLAEKVMGKVADEKVVSLGYYQSVTCQVAGQDALVSRTGYTGEDGFEIYLDAGTAGSIWHSLMQAGAEFEIEPVGLGCRDTLRLEMGYALYGNDIDERRTPVESGLMWITKLKKGDFIGRDAILKVKSDGPRERLIGFELEGRGVPRHGHRILSDGREVGVVTSGTFSPSLKNGIGMGYVATGTDGPLDIEIRNRTVPVRRVSLPFYKNGTVQSR